MRCKTSDAENVQFLFLATCSRAVGVGCETRLGAQQLASDLRPCFFPTQVAVEGCCHGELDAIYATLKELETCEKKAIDLLICCGDFQAVRNLDDLECMACPPKYRSMQSFYKYYSGQRVAPYPTLFSTRLCGRGGAAQEAHATRALA